MDEKSNALKKKTDSGSFLVRVWEEPRDDAALEPEIRGLVRNLQTGEERYLRDPEKIGDMVLRFLRSSRAEDEPGSESARQRRRN